MVTQDIAENEESPVPDPEINSNGILMINDNTLKLIVTTPP